MSDIKTAVPQFTQAQLVTLMSATTSLAETFNLDLKKPQDMEYAVQALAMVGNVAAREMGHDHRSGVDFVKIGTHIMRSVRFRINDVFELSIGL